MFDIKITVGNESLDHRDQLIRDMIYIGCLPYVSKKTFHEALDKCISWPLSDKGEDNINKSAKYKGCTYWSQDAYENHLLKHIKESPTGFEITDFSDSGLKHEHVVPRCIFIATMEKYFSELREKIKNKTKEECAVLLNDAFEKLKEHIDKKIFGCVVTDGEDKTILNVYKDHMPDNCSDFFAIQDPWARYKRSDYKKLYKVTWKHHINKNKTIGQGWDIVNKGELIDINTL